MTLHTLFSDKKDVILHNFTLALLYATTGYLGLQLALPPGFATAVFPPAGIAVAAIVMGGYRYLPGVFFGSFLLNLIHSAVWEDPSALSRLLFLSAFIAIGATLQGAASRFLVRKFGAKETTLSNEREVITFLTLVGPVASLISASVGIGSLLALGMIDWAAVPLSWTMWWAGDTIGATVIGPVCCLWLMPSSRPLTRRRWAVTLPLLGVFSASVVMFSLLSDQQQRDIRALFASQSESIASRFKEGLFRAEDAVHSLHAFYENSPNVSARQFKSFARRIYGRHDNVHALEWVENILHADRPIFEKFKSQEMGRPFEISVFRGKKKLRSPRKENYFVVTHIHPIEGNERAYGYDLASNGTRKSALLLAAKTNDVVITEPVKIVQEKQTSMSILATAPVYRDGDLKGFAIAVIRMSDILSAVLKIFLSKD